MTERDLCPDALIPPNLSRRGHVRSSTSDNGRVPGKLCPLECMHDSYTLQVSDNATHHKSLVDWEVAAACTADILSYCVVS